MTSHSCNPWIGLSNSTLNFADVLWVNQKIKVKIPSPFSPVPEDNCFHKSSNLMLALYVGSSLGARSRYLGRRECFLCTSILSSLPSTSMLCHMNMSYYSSTLSSTHHTFLVSFRRCSPLVRLSSVLSRLPLTLSEYLTTNECGNLLSSSPMNPESHLSRLIYWANGTK